MAIDKKSSPLSQQPLPNTASPTFQIVSSYLPGAIGRVLELQTPYYCDAYGFDHRYEAALSSEMGEFMSRFDPARDAFFLGICNGRIEASISVDGSRIHEHSAELRWLIVSESIRGSGYGDALFREALTFSENRGYQHLHLMTLLGLDVALHIYEKYDFQITQRTPGSMFGGNFECLIFERGIRPEN